MKYVLFYLSLILSLCLSIGSFIYSSNSPYIKYKMVNVCVLDRKEGMHKYKGREIKEYYLILKDEQNRKFKKEVSLKLYAKTIGSCFGFSLREMEIQHNSENQWKYSTVPMLLTVILGSYFLSMMILMIVGIIAEDDS